MPAEIADSDGESELDRPSQSEQLLPKHPPQIQQTQQTALSNDSEVNFSDFRSQEQRLHVQWRLRSPNLQQTANHAEFESGRVITGVADEPARGAHLLEHAFTASRSVSIQPEPAVTEVMPTSSRKRRHTMLGDGEEAGRSDHSSQKRQRKNRAKTYGTDTGHMSSSPTRASNYVSDELISTKQRDGGPHNALGFLSAASGIVDTATLLNPAMPKQPPSTSNSFVIEEEGENPRQRKRPRRVLSLIEKSTTETPREISTSRSSMGDYESINIDFRARASGLDAGTNPFGSLSQPLGGDEVDDAEREKTETESGLNRESTSAFVRTGAMDPPKVDDDSDKWNGYRTLYGPESHQTLEKSRSIDPVLLYNEPPNDTQLLSSSESFGRKSRKSTARPSMSPALDTDVNPINGSISDTGGVRANSSTGRRGKKAKKQHLRSQSPRRVNEEELELNSDELAIGLPREQYKPRPSRSRGATNEMILRPASSGPAAEEQIRNIDQQSSPVKQLTSELNLSDEAFVGLPKENYKPQSSRSRSKRIVVDEDEDPTGPESLQAANQPPASSIAAPNEVNGTLAKNAIKPKKPSKKTKVKRAKTSAGALLKKSEPMLSEGEEDVLWLETKPSQVKLDPPREIKPEKVPSGQRPGSDTLKAVGGNDDTDLEDQAGERPEPVAGAVSRSIYAANSNSTNVDTGYGSGTNTGTRRILVDVPPLSITPTQAEPKKRGRKKKASVAPVDESADFEEPSHGSEVSDVDADGVPEDEDVSAPPAKPQPKKRGRKKKVVDIPAELEKVNENIEQGSNVSFSEEKMNKSSRAALVEKDLNGPVPPTNLKTPKHTRPNLANETSSPEKKDRLHSVTSPLETPHKQVSMDVDSVKGPTEHSPINPMGGKALYRVGLSKRAAIPSLLKIVRKDIDRPKEKEKPKRRPQSHVPVEDED